MVAEQQARALRVAEKPPVSLRSRASRRRRPGTAPTSAHSGTFLRLRGARLRTRGPRAAAVLRVFRLSIFRAPGASKLRCTSTGVGSASPAASAHARRPQTGSPSLFWHECLDHVIVLTDEHLRRVSLRESPSYPPEKPHPAWNLGPACRWGSLAAGDVNHYFPGRWPASTTQQLAPQTGIMPPVLPENP